MTTPDLTGTPVSPAETGPVAAGAFVPDVVEIQRLANALFQGLTGAPAESFEVTAARYAAMPFARQTLVNRLKAFAKFNMTPFYPGYDLDTWDRQAGFPTPANPTLSIDNERWRADHSRLTANQPSRVPA